MRTARRSRPPNSTGRMRKNMRAPIRWRAAPARRSCRNGCSFSTPFRRQNRFIMRRVASLAFAPLLVLCAASQAGAQDAQTPVFRSGVDLLEVDVNVVDGNGRPIADVHAPEFSVSVDGQNRKVVSSEYIADDA